MLSVSECIINKKENFCMGEFKTYGSLFKDRESFIN